MPNHERLLKQRNHVRTVVSDDISKLQTSMQTVTEANRDEAHKLLGRLRGCHSEMNVLDQQVLAGVDDSLYDAELDCVYKHRASLTDAVTTLERKLKDFEAVVLIPQPSTSTSCAITDQLNERIPEMKLTEFDGNPLNFEEFWDDFTTSVDQRSDISTITKFKLLRKCLVGKAAACCKGYQLTKANYANIKSILEERYGDKETAIALHLDALIRLHPASSCAVSELIRLPLLMRHRCVWLLLSLSYYAFSQQCSTLFPAFYECDLPEIDNATQQPLTCNSDNIATVVCHLRETLDTCDGISENGTFIKKIPCRYTTGKSYKTALLLSIFLGWLGADRFYLGYIGLGLFKLFTVGFMLLFYLLDIVLIALQVVGPADGSSYLIDYYGPHSERIRMDHDTYIKPPDYN